MQQSEHIRTANQAKFLSSGFTVLSLGHLGVAFAAANNSSVVLATTCVVVAGVCAFLSDFSFDMATQAIAQENAQRAAVRNQNDATPTARLG